MSPRMRSVNRRSTSSGTSSRITGSGAKPGCSARSFARSCPGRTGRSRRLLAAVCSARSTSRRGESHQQWYAWPGWISCCGTSTVSRQPFGLPIGPERAAHVRPLGQVQTEPAQRVENLLLAVGLESGAMGVLDAQQEGAAWRRTNAMSNGAAYAVPSAGHQWARARSAAGTEGRALEHRRSLVRWPPHQAEAAGPVAVPGCRNRARPLTVCAWCSLPPVARKRPVDDQLCFALYAASRAMTGLPPDAGPLGLTYPQYLVLLVLWDRGDVDRHRHRTGGAAGDRHAVTAAHPAGDGRTGHRHPADRRRALGVGRPRRQPCRELEAEVVRGAAARRRGHRADRDRAGRVARRRSTG